MIACEGRLTRKIGIEAIESIRSHLPDVKFSPPRPAPESVDVPCERPRIAVSRMCHVCGCFGSEAAHQSGRSAVHLRVGSDGLLEHSSFDPH